jgi:hypothetical protein
VRSASALKRDCAYPSILSKLPPRDAKDRKRIESRKASADLGSLFHRAVEAWVKAGEGPPEALGSLHRDFNPDAPTHEVQGWLDALAAQWQPHGHGILTEEAWGLTPRGEYAPVTEPEPHVYVAEVPLLTAGRADAAWIEQWWHHDSEENDVMLDVLRVVDWKTGRHQVEEPGTNLQVNAAGIALARYVGAEAYRPGIYYARDAVFEWGEVVPLASGECGAILEEIRAAAEMDELPHPGEHCGACWEKGRCAEGTKYLADPLRGEGP